jgi:hypothetical protein
MDSGQKVDKPPVNHSVQGGLFSIVCLPTLTSGCDLHKDSVIIFEGLGEGVCLHQDGGEVWTVWAKDRVGWYHSEAEFEEVKPGTGFSLEGIRAIRLLVYPGGGSEEGGGVESQVLGNDLELFPWVCREALSRELVGGGVEVFTVHGVGISRPREGLVLGPDESREGIGGVCLRRVGVEGGATFCCHQLLVLLLHDFKLIVGGLFELDLLRGGWRFTPGISQSCLQVHRFLECEGHSCTCEWRI